MDDKKLQENIQRRYGSIAREGTGCGCGCGSDAESISGNVGYSKKQMEDVPKGANLGLGCGNPTAIASLREGETVLDLGSGAGFDAFISARQVGSSVRVIGVDMTPEMLMKARENARKGEYGNVEFREGYIEELPVESGSVNVVISNCVINLSPRKQDVFDEAYRVLKDGGRRMVSDIVLTREIPERIKRSEHAYSSCISGAILKENYIGAIERAGFADIKITKETPFGTELVVDDPEMTPIIGELEQEEMDLFARSVLSISVLAFKR